MAASSPRTRAPEEATGTAWAGVRAAYRDAWAEHRLAWASPAVALVGAYLAFYGAGLLITLGSLRQELVVILTAVLLGLGGMIVGVGVGWRRPVSDHPAPPSAAIIVRRWGAVLVGVGLLAMVAYFINIGSVPLFEPGVEQGRVDAAERGGAPLRVLSMLAIPGCWLLVADAVSRSHLRSIVVAGALCVVTAIGWLLTANRAPAFQTIEVAIIVGLLTAGRARLGPRGVALLGAAALVLVLGAGLLGALRLASLPVYGPPVPGAVRPPPNYPRLTDIAIRGYLRVPIQNLRYTMAAVPRRISWRLGTTYLLPILTVLPGKQDTFDQNLKDALGQVYAGGGTVPGLLGESYANFGPPGWLLIPAAAAFLLTLLYRRALTAASPAWWTLYGYAIIHVIGANLSGLSIASIFPTEAYAVLLVPVLWPRLQPLLARAVPSVPGIST